MNIVIQYQKKREKGCPDKPVSVSSRGKEVLMDNIRIPVPAVDFHPPVYYCRRAGTALQPDGNLDKDFWADAPFTDEFIDIQGAHMPAPRFGTRVKMLWDDENLYIGAQLYGDEIWGNVTGRDEVIFQDNDFEIFIDPDSDTQQYYEFEMNVLNTVWDLFLPAAYRDGGNAVNGYDIHGLRTAVAVKGSINRPDGKNTGWSAEVVIPFRAITECLPGKRAPKAGEYFRMNFSRVQWTVDKEDGCYRKRTDPVTGNPLPEDNWVWAPTGVINIHYPELWGFVFFTDGQEEVGRAGSIPEDERRKWELRKLYYAQQLYRDENGRYTDDFTALTEILHRHAALPENGRVLPLAYKISVTPHTFELSCPSADGKHIVVLYSSGKAEVITA